MRSPESPRRGRPFPERLAGLGLLLMALGVGLSISLFPSSLALVGLLVLLAWRLRRGRSRVLVVLAGALGLLSGGTSGAWNLPASFFDFAPAVLSVVGGVGASVGGVLLRIDGRSEWRPAWGSAALEGLAGGALVAVALSAYLSFVDRPTILLPDGRRAAVVEMQGDVFLPGTVEGEGGEPLAVLVRNRDWYAHTFTVAELGVDVYVGPLAERLVELPGGRGGRYTLTCAVTGHEEMRGRVLLGEGGS